MSISILSRVTAFRKLALDSNAAYETYRVRNHERYAGVYCIDFTSIPKNIQPKVWNNATADIAYFEALPEALSIINEQNRIIFELAGKLAQYDGEPIPNQKNNDNEGKE